MMRSPWLLPVVLALLAAACVMPPADRYYYVRGADGRLYLVRQRAGSLQPRVAPANGQPSAAPNAGAGRYPQAGDGSPQPPAAGDGSAQPAADPGTPATPGFPPAPAAAPDFPTPGAAPSGFPAAPVTTAPSPSDAPAKKKRRGRHGKAPAADPAPAPSPDTAPMPTAPGYAPASASPTPIPTAAAARAVKPHPSANGEVGLRVVYEPSQNAQHEQFRGYIEKAGLFDQLAVGLNGAFRFPHLVTIQWGECGAVNAFWDGESSRIVMCYELVDYLSVLFAKQVTDKQQLQAAVMSAVLFSFLHEFGHGAIAMFQLPAVGREEDAADQLAALVLIKAGGDSGVAVAMMGAQFFHLLAQTNGKQAYFDEHSLDDQRFYNVMCLVYGSDPQKRASMVGDRGLPASRARRCPMEYAKLGAAWDTLLKSHIRTSTADVAASQKTTGTCDGAVKHVVGLLTEKNRVELAGSTDPQAAQSAQSRVDQAGVEIRTQCRQQKWAKASIVCVEQAVSVAAIQKCNVLK